MSAAVVSAIERVIPGPPPLAVEQLDRFESVKIWLRYIWRKTSNTVFSLIPRVAFYEETLSRTWATQDSASDMLIKVDPHGPLVAAFE